MDNYKHFIAGVTNVALGYVHIITVIEEGVKPQVSSFVKLINGVKYEEGFYHIYYKEMKDVMKSFIIYWRETMDLAVKRADYLCHRAAEDIDRELMVLNVVNTIRLWQDYHKKFDKEFLPIESPQQQKIYDDLKEKFLDHMKQLHDIKHHVERMDRNAKVVAFAKEQYAKSVESKNQVFLYAHDYLSMLLADHLPEIGGSLKEIVCKIRGNLKELYEGRERRVAELLQKLYDKNKEHLIYTREHKGGSMTHIAELSTRIDAIRQQVLQSGNHDAIFTVKEKLELFQKRLASFQRIENTLNVLKAELEKTYREESVYNTLMTTELPGSKFECWQEMGKNFAGRKEELKEQLVKAAKALTTFFVVRSTNDEVTTYENESGQLYSVDMYGHINYHCDYGLNKMHVDCEGKYFKPYDHHLIYFNEHGRHFRMNNENYYQRAECGSIYKLGDDLLMKKLTTDCGHSEMTKKDCGLNCKDRTVDEILPDLDPMDIKSTLNAEVVKYLWDAFGAILPDALYEVCKLKPKNPIHWLAHSLLRHKYNETTAVLLQKKNESDAYRMNILKGRKDKAIADTLAWKARLPKRGKPEDADDSYTRDARAVYAATSDLIASLNYYNDDMMSAVIRRRRATTEES